MACMWDLVPRPGIEPGPPALGAWSLNHCATGEVLHVVLIYISLMINDIKHLFMNLLASHIYFSVKKKCKYFAHFKIGFFSYY